MSKPDRLETKYVLDLTYDQLLCLQAMLQSSVDMLNDVASCTVSVSTRQTMQSILDKVDLHLL